MHWGNEMIAVVDYGMGNLRSVQKAFEHVGAKAVIVDRPEDIDAADRVVLPGGGGVWRCDEQSENSGIDHAYCKGYFRRPTFFGYLFGGCN